MNTSQHTTSHHANRQDRGHSNSIRTGSAREYLSERDGKQSSEKRIYRLILRSEDSEAQKLRDFLQSEHGRLDITCLFDRQGYSPLSYAVYKDKTHAARALLEYVRTTESTISFETPQSPKGHRSPRSFQGKSLSLSEWVNARNVKQQGMSAIHYAAFNGDLKIMKELVACGADIRQMNDTGISAL